MSINQMGAYLDPQAYAMASSAQIEEWWTAIEGLSSHGMMPISRHIMAQNAQGKWKPLEKMDGDPAVRLYLAVTWQTGVDSMSALPPV